MEETEKKTGVESDSQRRLAANIGHTGASVLAGLCLRSYSISFTSFENCPPST